METEYLKRWRMALGGNAADGTGVTLTVEEQRLDSSLEAVYDLSLIHISEPTRPY